jgi:hypothetical protein
MTHGTIYGFFKTLFLKLGCIASAFTHPRGNIRLTSAAPLRLTSATMILSALRMQDARLFEVFAFRLSASSGGFTRTVKKIRRLNEHYESNLNSYTYY